MKEITIDLNNVNPNQIYDLGYQYDHRTTKITFTNTEPGVAYKLLIDLKPQPCLISIVDNIWLISNTYTQEAGSFVAQIRKMVDGEWIAHTPLFQVIINDSVDMVEPLEEIPPRFEDRFNEMFNIINECERKLKNGEFNGKSAYQIAVSNGFKGTEQEWLKSLDYEHSQEFTDLANQVRTDSQQVSQDKVHVDEIAKQVDSKANEVSANATQVAKDKTQVSQDKVHVDTVVKEFDNVTTQANKNFADKVTQANNLFDTKVLNANQGIDTKVNEFDTKVSEANTTIDTKVKQAQTSASEALESANKAEKIKDEMQSSIDKLKIMFNLMRTDKVYSIEIPTWETSQGFILNKTDDNANMVCDPSTLTTRGRNDYEDLPWFKTIDVNAIVTDTGERVITAVKGDENYSETNADVFVCGMSYYEKWEDLHNGYYKYSRTFLPRDGFELNPLCINKDGSIQPYFLIAKYPLSVDGAGKPVSQPNKIVTSYISGVNDVKISNNDGVDLTKKKGVYYSLSTMQEINGYVTTTWWLMFGNMNSDEIMTGVTGLGGALYPEENAESVNYVILKNTDANQIEIGSTISIGHEVIENSKPNTDRAKKEMHETCYSVKVLKKEKHNELSQKIYVDSEPFIIKAKTDGAKATVIPMAWQTGFSANIKGRTGSPCVDSSGLKNRMYPIVFNGIELQLGFYEVQSGFTYQIDELGATEIYELVDASKQIINPTKGSQGYKLMATFVPTKNQAWNYITDVTFDNGCIAQKAGGQVGSGDRKYIGDGVYINSAINNTCEILSLGLLWNGGTSGLMCLNLGNGRGNSGWHIGSRLSINSVRGE